MTNVRDMGLRGWEAANVIPDVTDAEDIHKPCALFFLFVGIISLNVDLNQNLNHGPSWWLELSSHEC